MTQFQHPKINLVAKKLVTGVPELPLGQMWSLDDVTISLSQAISQLFSSYPPSAEFCHVSELTIQKKPRSHA